jgi:2-hydroxychromene-2-carboxylate isomerase
LVYWCIGLLEFFSQKKLISMIKSFDFYFDFVSPYSFLAHKEIKKIEKKNSIKIKYKPILLGGLHNLHGIKAPAFIPAKAKHMIRDCKLIAEKNKIKFKFNSYFPIRSLNLMRGVLIAEEDDFKNYYIDNIFNSIWQDGLNMNDENIIQKVLKNLNTNPKTFLLRSASSSIKDSLKKKTNEAYEKGIFGAPSFVSNNKIFWGQDRIEFALNEASK